MPNNLVQVWQEDVKEGSLGTFIIDSREENKVPAKEGKYLQWLGWVTGRLNWKNSLAAVVLQNARTASPEEQTPAASSPRSSQLQLWQIQRGGKTCTRGWNTPCVPSSLSAMSRWGFTCQLCMHPVTDSSKGRTQKRSSRWRQQA